VQNADNNEYKNKFKDSLAKGRANLKLKNMQLTYEEKKDYLAKSEKAKVSKVRSGARSLKLEVPKDLLVPGRKRIISHTKYVLDADIKECLENISHS
jgi:hypothetical protein